MDKFEFFKEQYSKEIERKNEITNSFSTPIGIISALVAGLFYSLTTFEFSYSILLSGIFIGLVLAAICFLSLSVYHLIKAISDFHAGFTYAYLSNADTLNDYHVSLKEYYIQNGIVDTSDADFAEYILEELIKTTSINQTNNDRKIYHRFQCNIFMIAAFLALCAMTVPFAINFGMKKAAPNIQKVSIDSSLNVNLKSQQNQSFIDSSIIKIIQMADEKKKVEKPEKPQTKMLTEGKNPKTETRTFSKTEKAKEGDKKKGS